jgi:hypothetical protein
MHAKVVNNPGKTASAQNFSRKTYTGGKFVVSSWQIAVSSQLNDREALDGSSQRAVR